MIEKKKPLVHIQHWRDEEIILSYIKDIQKANGKNGKPAPYADTMRKIVRDGIKANVSIEGSKDAEAE